MNASITSGQEIEKITAGQIDQLVRVIQDASRSTAEGVVKELAAAGTLNKSNFQQVVEAGDKVKKAVASALRNLIPELAKVRLRCISLGEKLVLKPTSGKRTIAKAKKLFSYIDGDFKSYGTDVSGEAREETAVDVHELLEDSTFAEMFSSLPTSLDDLCLTQDQIIEFVETMQSWLRKDGYATFFLFKVEDQFFVADVSLHSDGGLEVYVRPFSYVGVWGAEDRRRMVVPQLTLATA